MYSNLIMYSFSSRSVWQKEKGLPQLHLCSGRTTVCTGAIPVQTEMLKKTCSWNQLLLSLLETSTVVVILVSYHIDM